MITFNGSQRLITVSDDYAISEIYSAWKNWVLQDSNAKYPQAFKQNGGESLGGGLFSGINTFICNQTINAKKGWRLQPKGDKGELFVRGNIFADNPSIEWTLPPNSGDYAYFNLQTASQTQVAKSNSEISTEQIKQIAELTALKVGSTSCTEDKQQFIEIVCTLQAQSLQVNIKDNSHTANFNNSVIHSDIKQNIQANINNKNIQVML